jgi:hypothetical protein
MLHAIIVGAEIVGIMIVVGVAVFFWIGRQVVKADAPMKEGRQRTHMLTETGPNSVPPLKPFPCWTRHGQSQDYSLELPGVPIRVSIMYSGVTRDPDPFWITVEGKQFTINLESDTLEGAQAKAESALREIATNISDGLAALRK